MMDTRLVESIKEHEGFRAHAYDDGRGNLTIGFGTRINELEIGEGAAAGWVVRELEEKAERLAGVVGFAELDPVRQAVLLEMSYWMGVGGCLRFRRMWAALRDHKFPLAAAEMLDSRTGRDPQLRGRMETLARRMNTGRWGPE